MTTLSALTSPCQYQVSWAEGQKKAFHTLLSVQRTAGGTLNPQHLAFSLRGRSTQEPNAVEETDVAEGCWSRVTRERAGACLINLAGRMLGLGSEPRLTMFPALHI